MERFIYQDGVRYNVLHLPKYFVVKGDLNLGYMGLTELPDLSTIRVEGSFYCNDNYLTTLYGSPTEVKRNFFAGHNKLRSPEGCTRIIPLVFEVCDNQLITLENGPEFAGTYLCQRNLLKSLKGVTINEMVRFDCRGNPLESLDFAPFLVKTALYDRNTIPRESRCKYDELVWAYNELLRMNIIKQRYTARDV